MRRRRRRVLGSTPEARQEAEYLGWTDPGDPEGTRLYTAPAGTQADEPGWTYIGTTEGGIELDLTPAAAGPAWVFPQLGDDLPEINPAGMTDEQLQEAVHENRNFRLPDGRVVITRSQVLPENTAIIYSPTLPPEDIAERVRSTFETIYGPGWETFMQPGPGWEIEANGQPLAADLLSEITGIPVRVEPHARGSMTCPNLGGGGCLRCIDVPPLPDEVPWSRPDADVAGELRRAIGAMEVMPEMIGREPLLFDHVNDPAEFPGVVPYPLPPVCPAHGTEMAYVPSCRWFRCDVYAQNTRCRYVLTDENRRREGSLAQITWQHDPVADEFTGAMSEAEHRRIRMEMGLDVPIPAEFREEEDAEFYEVPEPEPQPRGLWTNREHP